MKVYTGNGHEIEGIVEGNIMWRFILRKFIFERGRWCYNQNYFGRRHLFWKSEK